MNGEAAELRKPYAGIFGEIPRAITPSETVYLYPKSGIDHHRGLKLSNLDQIGLKNMGPSEPAYVITTRPVIPPYPQHPTISTTNPHIILRPFRVEDLDELHELRSQIEVMQWTSTQKVDADINRTKSWMSLFMDLGDEHKDWSTEKFRTTNPKYANASAKEPCWNFVIVYRERPPRSDSEANHKEMVIGAAGCLIITPEPECGYMIRKEYWGQGIATAALRAILESYWNLERTTVKLPWDPEKHKHNIYEYLPDAQSVAPDTLDAVTVHEVLGAEIAAGNTGSKRVLEKCGFARKRSYLVEENGSEVELVQYTLARPRS